MSTPSTHVQTTCPDITIVTVCYNALTWLPDCINSVCNQRTSDLLIEHIIIDGNSTDGTKSLLKNMLTQGCINTYISESDHGIYDAMNKGLTLAKGKIIAFLNADDLFLPGSITALATPILQGHADYTIGTARVLKEGILSHYLWPDLGNAFMGAICCHQTLFCKTQIMRDLGGFDQTVFPTIADGDLMAKLVANNYTAYCVSGEHVIFRDGGASADCMVTAADQYVRLIEKHWSHICTYVLDHPAHFYRVHWDLKMKMNNLQNCPKKDNEKAPLFAILAHLQKDLMRLTPTIPRANCRKLQYHYLFYRIISKFLYGNKRRIFLQKKYFAKQQLKWLRSQ